MSFFFGAVALANRAVAIIGAIALIGITVATAYDVVARYLFHAPTIWATEVSLYLLQLTVFLPMGLLVQKNGHLCSTLIVDRLSPRKHRIAYTMSMVTVAGYAALLTWLGWNATASAWSMEQLSPTLLEVPLWIPNSLMPVGFFLLLVSAIGASLNSPANRGGDA